MKIYFEDIKGCYSDSAILKFFPFFNKVDCKSFLDVFEKIGDDECGFIPIENVAGGRIEENFLHLINFNF